MKKIYIQDILVRKRLFWIKEAQRLGVNKACLKLGIYKSQFYYWKHRFDSSGIEGLKNKSKKPHHSPKLSSQEIVDLVLDLRTQTERGADTISLLLKQKHQLIVKRSTINKILKREGFIQKRERTPKKKHIRRYSSSSPGDRVQIDVKYVPYKIREGTKGRAYQYTAIDDCTRVRFIKIYDGHGIYQLMDFMKELISYFPFKIKLIQTDNHVIFTYKYTSHRLAFRKKPKEHFLEKFCRDHDILHHLIEPGEPELNGKVERSHRTDSEFFYRYWKFTQLKPLQEQFSLWLDHYNHERPHWGLKGQTPVEKLKLFNYQLRRLNYDSSKTYSLAA